MYNLTRNGQPMNFPSTIKPQFVKKWETCDYYWTFLGSFGQRDVQNWLAKISNNGWFLKWIIIDFILFYLTILMAHTSYCILSLFLLLIVGEDFYFICMLTLKTCQRDDSWFKVVRARKIKHPHDNRVVSIYSTLVVKRDTT